MPEIQYAAGDVRTSATIARMYNALGLGPAVKVQDVHGQPLVMAKLLRALQSDPMAAEILDQYIGG
jgi:hypothetical protein